MFSIAEKEEKKQTHHKAEKKHKPVMVFPEDGDKSVLMQKVLKVAAVIIIILLVVGGVSMLQKDPEPETLISEPPALSLTAIVDETCDLCVDMAQVIDLVKKTEVIVESEQILNKDSEEAQSLIEKYDIQTLPTLIVTGDVEKASFVLTGLTERGDAYVFDNKVAPFINLSTGKLVGIVNLTYLSDRSCEKCYNFDLLIQQFQQLEVQIDEIIEVPYDSEEGKEVISRYNLTKAPAMIFTNEFGYYSHITPVWETVGYIADDGSYVFSKTPPPYTNISTGAVRGEISATFIVDETCIECYDPIDVHNKILVSWLNRQFNSTPIDVNSEEGQKLVAEYDIKQVPTILIQGDTEVYRPVQAWSQVGSIEDDGTLVFRKNEVFGGSLAYRNLETGEVILPPAPDATV